MWYLTVNEEEPTPGEDMDETDSTAEILYAHQLKGEADALQQLSSRKIKRYFGTVPPRTSLDQDKVASYADSIAKSLNSLPALDGFLVYDIQEEAPYPSTCALIIFNLFIFVSNEGREGGRAKAFCIFTNLRAENVCKAAT